MRYVLLVHIIFILNLLSCSFESTRFTSIDVTKKVNKKKNRIPASLKVVDCNEQLFSLSNYYEDKKRRYLSTQFLKNTCEHGKCWAPSLLKLSETTIKNNFDEEVELSSIFIFKKHILEQIEEHLNTFINDGYTFSNSFNSKNIINNNTSFDRAQLLSKKYGAIPQYTSVESFSGDLVASNNIHFKKQLFKFLSTLSRSREVIDLTKKYSDLNLITIDEKKELLRTLRNKAKKIFFKFYKEDKESFVFNEKLYTPLSFYKNFELDKSIIHTVYRTEDSSNTSQISKVLKRRIDINEVTYANVYWPDSVVNRDLNVIEPVNKSYSKSVAMKLRKKTGHAVVIVGYELDSLNRVKNFIIENNYGDKKTDNIRLKVKASFLLNFIRSIHFTTK